MSQTLFKLSPASASRCASVRAFLIRASEKAKTPARGAFANVGGDYQAGAGERLVDPISMQSTQTEKL